MTTSMHASLPAIGRRLQDDYLPTVGKPLPSEFKDLLAQLVAIEAGTRGPTGRFAEVAADVVFSAIGPAAAVEIWSRLKNGIFDPYRPELHYMRGPGPKCREKAEAAGT